MKLEEIMMINLFLLFSMLHLFQYIHQLFLNYKKDMIMDIINLLFILLKLIH